MFLSPVLLNQLAEARLQEALRRVEVDGVEYFASDLNPVADRGTLRGLLDDLRTTLDVVRARRSNIPAALGGGGATC